MTSELMAASSLALAGEWKGEGRGPGAGSGVEEVPTPHEEEGR